MHMSMMQSHRRIRGHIRLDATRTRLRCPSAPKLARAGKIAAFSAGQQIDVPPLLNIDDEFDHRHRFASYSNWIIPGYVMLGQYPFIDPKQCQKREDGERRLQQILAAGITTFVALQGNLPPQQEIPARGIDGFMPYKATADLIAAGLSGPPPGEIVEGLRNPYLDKFVPPRRREPSESYKNYKPLRPEYVHLPFAAAEDPVDALQKGVEDLEGRVNTGQKLYIHCWGGGGLTGVVGACLLGKLYGVSQEEATERVRWAFVLRQGPEGSKALSNQRDLDFVQEYFQSLQ